MEPGSTVEYACQIRPPDQPEAMCGEPAWRMAARCPDGHVSEVSLCGRHRGLMGLASCMAVGPGIPECGKPVTFKVLAKSPGFTPPSDEGIRHELAQPDAQAAYDARTAELRAAGFNFEADARDKHRDDPMYYTAGGIDA